MARTKVPRKNIAISQGSDYYHEIYYTEVDGTPIDISGYGAECNFRELEESTTAFFVATTANSKLSVDGVNGKVTLHVPNADSTAFTILKGYYDVEIIAPDTQVTRIVQGTVTIDREITR